MKITWVVVIVFFLILYCNYYYNNFDLVLKNLRTQLSDARDTFTKLAETNAQNTEVYNK